MPFPSITALATRARSVLARFPWTLLAGTAAAAFAVAATYPNDPDTLVRLTMVALLGLPATVAVALTAERHGWPPLTRHAAQLGVVLALAAFYAVWPGPDQKHDMLRWLQLAAALHLAVAVLPWLGTRETRGFWQYNRRLFLGFLRAGIFSAVLFFGVIIALVALDSLFGLDVPDETIVRVWFVAAFIVNTWIFLAGVPEELSALEHDTEYPRALKLFAQYVLTPLAFTYLLILLAYLVKLLIGGEWPSGWIGWLVSSVAVTGILGFLLVHPLRDDADEGWIRTYTRWLFVGLVPASLMLLVAFWKRIAPYGMTELRVIGVVLGVWLLVMSLGYAMRPGAGIRRIPLSLAVLLLVMLFGPLNPSAISVRSQRDRLAELLPTAAVDREDAREASAALRFLVEHDARGAIETAVGRELPATVWDTAEHRWETRDSVGARVMALAGAPYVSEHQHRAVRDGSFTIGARTSEPRNVAGFTWMTEIGSGDTVVPLGGADTLRSELDTMRATLTIRLPADTFTFDLAPLLALRGEARDTTVSAGALQQEDRGGRARLVFTRLSGGLTDSTITPQYWSGTLLVR